MKKLLAIFCIIGMMASMVACGEKDESISSESSSEATTSSESLEKDTDKNSDSDNSNNDSSEAEPRNIPENSEFSFDSVDASELTVDTSFGDINFKSNPDWTAETDSNNEKLWNFPNGGIILTKNMDLSNVEEKEKIDSLFEHMGDGVISAGYEIVNEEFVTIKGLKTYHVCYNMKSDDVVTTCNMFMFLNSDNTMLYSFNSQEKEESTEIYNNLVKLLSTITI
ncbi:MAG: hypothetical protein IJZ64_00955 [Ruminococcus sp.]|nr:hypothetical protein [Ruminococcus sp.]